MDTILISMFVMRLISSLIEFCGALLFLKFNSVETALRINAILGLIGPLFFSFISFVGLYSLAGRISLIKFLLIFTGILLVIIGTTTN